MDTDFAGDAAEDPWCNERGMRHPTPLAIVAKVWRRGGVCAAVLGTGVAVKGRQVSCASFDDDDLKCHCVVLMIPSLSIQIRVQLNLHSVIEATTASPVLLGNAVMNDRVLLKHQRISPL